MSRKQVEVGDFVLWHYSSAFTPHTYLGAIVDKVEGKNVYADASRWGPGFCITPVLVTTVDDGCSLLARLKRAEERMNQAIEAAKASFEAERDSIIKKS